MIEKKIIELVAEQFAVDADSLSRSTAFIDTLSADSLDIVELTMSVEEEFSIPEVAEEDLQKILTIGDLVDYVEGAIG
ncbi:MAG TPA: acyl carrier protein [Clostridiales bacterium]|nr:acyl carrier protein [Clostridiales bacterium]